MKKSTRTLLTTLTAAALVGTGTALAAPAQAAECSIQQSFGPPTFTGSAVLLSGSLSVSDGCSYGSSYYIQLRKQESLGYAPEVAGDFVSVEPGYTSRLTVSYPCQSSGSQNWFGESNIQPYSTETVEFPCS